MSLSKFQGYQSVKYQNLSNRMQRLRHTQNYLSTKQNNITNLSYSVQKPDTTPKILQKNSSSTLLLQNTTSSIKVNNILGLNSQREDNDLGTRQYTGRVTKNTGIKKYNQRMLKQIGNINTTKQKSPPKYSAYNNFIQNNNEHNEINKSKDKPQLKEVSPYKLRRSINQSSPRKYYNIEEKPYEVEVLKKTQHINSNSYETKNVVAKRIKLQPGKIYTKQQLQEYFK